MAGWDQCEKWREREKQVLKWLHHLGMKGGGQRERGVKRLRVNKTGWDGSLHSHPHLNRAANREINNETQVLGWQAFTVSQGGLY